MTRDVNLVRRLIAFLKKPDALAHPRRERVTNAYDDLEPRDAHSAASAQPDGDAPSEDRYAAHELLGDGDRSPNYGSRLDALVVRAIQQFNAHSGFVLRYEHDGRMRYCTGRDVSGRFVPHTDAKPNRRAVYTTLDSGQPQLFMRAADGTPVPVLCGPLWSDDKVIGVLYLDAPVRSRVHRGVFDVFCDQAARLLREGLT